MVKICQTCGTQITDDQSQVCTKCGASLLQESQILDPFKHSFKYSNKFVGVIALDILISFLFGIGGIGIFFDDSSSGYNQPIWVYFIVVMGINFLIDCILLFGKDYKYNIIDARLARIKCLFGGLGIFTVISFLYFGIISWEMRSITEVNDDEKLNPAISQTNNSYNPVTPKDIDNQLNELKKFQDNLDLKKKEQIKSQIGAAKENIVKLQDSGNIPLIYNFVTRYPNSNLSDQNFVNLKILLAKKGIVLTDLELVAVINGVKQEGELEWVKKRILYNNPTSSDGCIKNYIEVFGKICKNIQRDRQNIQRERLINYLIKILKDNFNYQGDLASDLIRIEKQVELERFEISLTGQASGNRITINDIERINGYDFERVLKELFEKMGYRVIHTTLSNDQGADLIVEKFGVKTVIQAKNWQNNVTNSGIQEVVAAIKHYDAQRAMVISSSDFTQSARELARSNNVILWDRSILATMLDENPIFRD